MKQSQNESLQDVLRETMLPLFDDDKGTTAYEPIYEVLTEVREEFHRSGRFDDSNAKLDEVVKLFATYLALRLGDLADFPIPGTVTPGFMQHVQECFRRAARLPYYLRNDGTSIFGNAPSLVLEEADAALALRLTRLVVKAVDEAFRHQALGNPYDVLNEAFGHFVRDNFRGNTRHRMCSVLSKRDSSLKRMVVQIKKLHRYVSFWLNITRGLLKGNSFMLLAVRNTAVKLGRAIRRIRTDCGISQEGLAALSSVDRTFMGEIERGEANPSFEVLQRIVTRVVGPKYWSAYLPD